MDSFNKQQQNKNKKEKETDNQQQRENKIYSPSNSENSMRNLLKLIVVISNIEQEQEDE